MNTENSKLLNIDKIELLKVKDLVKHFKDNSFLHHNNTVHKAVDGISFSINKGDTFGLIGESGCGKTTAARTIIRLLQPDGGRIFYNSTDITDVDMKPLRKKMQMIFQNSYASMDPRMTAAEVIGEPLDIYKHKGRKERKEKIFDLLKLVGLSEEYVYRYPYQPSGGQRQRVCIARALAVEPEFIICDEPVSSLDVLVQQQIIDMLMSLQADKGLTFMLITHDLSSAFKLCSTIGVMYRGKLLELSTARELYKMPAHPYTRLLISALPMSGQNIDFKKNVQNKEQMQTYMLSGCKFYSRCPYADKICSEREPELTEIYPNHLCACHRLPNN